MCIKTLFEIEYQVCCAFALVFLEIWKNLHFTKVNDVLFKKILPFQNLYGDIKDFQGSRHTKTDAFEYLSF